MYFILHMLIRSEDGSGGIEKNLTTGHIPPLVTNRYTMPPITRVTAEHNLGTLTQYRTENPDGVKDLCMSTSHGHQGGRQVTLRP